MRSWGSIDDEGDPGLVVKQLKISGLGHSILPRILTQSGLVIHTCYMKRWTNGWMVESWMGAWMGGQTDAYGWIRDGFVDGQRGGWMDILLQVHLKFKRFLTMHNLHVPCQAWSKNVLSHGWLKLSTLPLSRPSQPCCTSVTLLFRLSSHCSQILPV